jgi:hypothetical protein
VTEGFPLTGATLLDPRKRRDNGRVPRTRLEGEIPLTASATGNNDALECILLKIGIDSSEFTTSTGSGRVHVYPGNNGTPTGGRECEK